MGRWHIPDGSGAVLSVVGSFAGTPTVSVGGPLETSTTGTATEPGGAGPAGSPAKRRMARQAWEQVAGQLMSGIMSVIGASVRLAQAWSVAVSARALP